MLNLKNIVQRYNVFTQISFLSCDSADYVCVVLFSCYPGKGDTPSYNSSYAERRNSPYAYSLELDMFYDQRER